MSKRIFDIVVASIGLLLLSPVMLAVAFWIKRDSPGPVFYRGRRAGRGGIPFFMLKFRSMVIDADRIGGPTTAGNDARITPSGRFVRRYKLDELPQLINVLRGDMSLVGPRPEVVDKVEAYSWRERRILALRPGITDWASIWNSDEGGVLAGAPDADDAYERVIRPGKLKLQLYYLESRSFLADLKIIAATLVRIVYKHWTPAELRGYPTFAELRGDVARLVATEQIYRRAA
jgi:lipopolysaccharide/colanic/teichoic acid biosynthesis glycosyltransferase